MTARRTGLVVASMLAGVLVTWQLGWWSSEEAPSPTADASIGVATGLSIYGVDDRSPAPDVEGTTLDGDRLALNDLIGHVVVVNVWGSWCGPCRAEAPDLARVARETSGRGVRFVGIDTRDDDAAARAFVRAFKIPYPSLIDRDGKLILAFDGIIPVSAVPSTVLLDADGRIAARVIGRVTYSTLSGLVNDLLREQRADTEVNGEAK